MAAACRFRPNFDIHKGWLAAALTLLVTIFAWSFSMMDVVMLVIGFAFFALSIAYVYACDLL